MSATRREALRRGIAGVGALAVPPALLAAAPALAQESAETGALARLIELEQAAALAYSEASSGETLKAGAKTLAEQLGVQEDDHREALTAAIEQLGVEAPEAPDAAGEVEVLADFERAETQRELIDFFVALEEELVAAYLDAATQLEAEDLLRTGAQVGASHAQHLVAWRLIRGDGSGAAVSLQELGRAAESG